MCASVHYISIVMSSTGLTLPKELRSHGPYFCVACKENLSFFSSVDPV